MTRGVSITTHSPSTPRPPPSDVLDTGASTWRCRTSRGQAKFLFVEPLVNDAKCQRCHGPDQPLRGAIAIKLDTTKERAMSASSASKERCSGGSRFATALILL